jgi:hypothetical protein
MLTTVENAIALAKKNKVRSVRWGRYSSGETEVLMFGPPDRHGFERRPVAIRFAPGDLARFMNSLPDWLDVTFECPEG